MATASTSSRSETSSRSYSSAFESTSAVNFSPRTWNVRVQGQRSSPSVRFLSEEKRAESPGRRSLTVTSKSERKKEAVSSSEKRTCMCSPTTHPGSFRCAYHKQVAASRRSSSRKVNVVRSSMRIGGVEGEVVRRALTTLIRPSSHHLRRRQAFQPRPTRLSLMSKAQPQDHSI